MSVRTTVPWQLKMKLNSGVLTTLFYRFLHTKMCPSHICIWIFTLLFDHLNASKTWYTSSLFSHVAWLSTIHKLSPLEKTKRLRYRCTKTHLSKEWGWWWARQHAKTGTITHLRKGMIVRTRGERYYRSYIVSRILALFGKYRISVILRQYRDILYDIFDQIALSLWSLEETKLNRQF